MTIPGGFYLKARCIKDSWIAHAAPVVRETWDYLLREANHKPVKYDGFVVKRGQVFTTYSAIRESLHWKVGFRKQTYSEAQMKHTMKHLRKHTMIDTMKHPRGVLITISNYNKFQSIKNYEAPHEAPHEAPYEAPHEAPLGRPSINKNVKNKRIKEVKKNLTTTDKKIVFESGVLKNIKTEFIDKCNSAYPAIDIKQEIAKAEVWLLANPKNKKSNYERFLVNWFTRAQDRAPKGINDGTKKSNFDWLDEQAI